MSTLNEEIANRLREVRHALDCSQSKMAAKLDISDRAYKSYELGKREIPLSTALKFCEINSIEPKWLLLGDGNKYTSTDIDISISAVKALLNEMNAVISINDTPINIDTFTKQVAYVVRQAIEKGTTIEEEAKSLASVIIK